MAATTEDRNTAQRLGDEFNHPVAASTTIFMGSLIVLDASGDAEPATTATGKVCIGRAEEAVDNSAGAAGDKTVQVRKGAFHFGNDGSIDRANIGDTAYLVDDQTLADTDGTGTRSAAGTIVDVDADGVWVQIS